MIRPKKTTVTPEAKAEKLEAIKKELASIKVSFEMDEKNHGDLTEVAWAAKKMGYENKIMTLESRIAALN